MSMVKLLHAADLHLDSAFSALPPEKAAGLVTPVTPTGALARNVTRSGGTFPAVPVLSASAATSAYSAPAGIVPSSAVTKRISPAVVHTVPAGIVSAFSRALSVRKRSTPRAFLPSRRVMPRSRP